MRRSGTLITLLAFALLLVCAGVAVAATIRCGEKCVGTKDQDTLVGTSGPNNMYGRSGDDTLKAGENSIEKDPVDKVYGQKGDDKLYAQGGYDLLYGGAGDNVIDTGYGYVHVYGGPGNDRLIAGAYIRGNIEEYVFSEDWGRDTIVNEPHRDPRGRWISFRQSNGSIFTADVRIDLSRGIATHGANSVVWTPSMFSAVQAGAGDDTIWGDRAYNQIDGGDGDDTIDVAADGGVTVDTVDGDEGNDTIYAAGDSNRPGAGRDFVSCGNGVDKAVIDGDEDSVERDCEDVVKN